MDQKDKAILYLSIIVFALLICMFYIFKQNDNIPLQLELSKSKARIEMLEAQNDSLKTIEGAIVNDIDSIENNIAAQDGTIIEIKYIYKDAKLNLFNLSTDSSMQLFTSNLSKADSLRW
jgi:hypothetical protein